MEGVVFPTVYPDHRHLKTWGVGILNIVAASGEATNPEARMLEGWSFMGVPGLLYKG